MATVNKDFRVKNGLVVEGTTATVNGDIVLTEASTTFLNNLIEDTTGGLLSNATLENITISYDDETNALTITAENGVADSDTDDLSEGETNLYFTDERAQDAFGALVTSGTYTGLSFTYDDEDNKITVSIDDQFTTHDTDDLDEGETNLYFTDQRVKDVLTGSTQTNISITEVEGDLVITAENGVDDSTTDDLDEGDTNLYFTDTRVYNKSKSVITAGDGISLISDDEVETVEVIVDTNVIASKEYVDAVAQGLKIRGNVEAATTEDLGATYSNGTNGVDATLTIPATAELDIDGWTSWSEFDGILVKDQNDEAQNGRYFVFVVGDAETAWVLKRCVDCDTAEEIPGSFVFVQHGTTYGSTGWVATVENSDTFTVGTDDINWVQFSGAGTYVGGTGIELDGQNISIDFTEFDTDDIDEGATNLYHTDQRVKDVLTGSSQTNISITEVEGVLTIEAENGVADSDTDDLAEGETNLYFTDQRAVDAIEAVVPAFTAVEINSSLQVAASLGLTTAEVPYTVFEFDKAVYRSAKFLVKSAAGSHTQISEVLLTLDTSDNVAITEYAVVATNGNLVDITATISEGNVALVVTPVNSNTTATAFGTLIV
jgi:hypothetical protein